MCVFGYDGASKDSPNELDIVIRRKFKHINHKGIFFNGITEKIFVSLS